MHWVLLEGLAREREERLLAEAAVQRLVPNQPGSRRLLRVPARPARAARPVRSPRPGQLRPTRHVRRTP